MKLFKYIGLFGLICLTFFYTEKVMNVTIEQDEIMIRIKEYQNEIETNAINAVIDGDAIIPGCKGKYIDMDVSYKNMKKIGYFEPALIVYKDIYPEVSIYNNYHKYIIKGNNANKNVSLIYILNNGNTIDNILNIIDNKEVKLNFFVGSNFLNNNMNIIDKIKDHAIYNYGNNGEYTKDNLIMTNNIINNKAHNNANICLFLKKDENSLNNCANSKMLSLLVNNNVNYINIKNNLSNGDFYLINNTQELKTIIDYIISKGFKIVPLSELIIE